MSLWKHKPKTNLCCPPFEPAPWEDTMITWQDKQFIKDKVFTLFNMPMNFGQVMKRLDKKVRGAGAVMQDNLCLSDHTSKWNMDLYLAVDKEVPGADNTYSYRKILQQSLRRPVQRHGKMVQRL